MYKALQANAIGQKANFEEQAAMAAKTGFKGVQVNLPSEYAMGAAKVKEILAKYGLVPSHCGLTVDFRTTEDSFVDSLKDWEKYVKFAAELGLDRCATWITPTSDTLTYGENFELTSRRLRACARVLEAYGIRFGLEFVGPKTKRDLKYDFIHNLNGFFTLCEAIGTSNLGLLLDIIHWDTSGQTKADFKRLTEKQIVLVHVNDGAEGRTLEEQIDKDRRLPGATGVFNAKDFVAGLKEMNYTGPVMAEPCYAPLHDMTFEAAARLTSESISKIGIENNG